MTHCTEIVNFCGSNLGNDRDEVCRVAQVTIVKEQFNPCFVAILVDVVDTSRVETRGSTDDTVYLQTPNKLQRGRISIDFLRANDMN